MRVLRSATTDRAPRHPAGGHAGDRDRGGGRRAATDQDPGRHGDRQHGHRHPAATAELTGCRGDRVRASPSRARRKQKNAALAAEFAVEAARTLRAARPPRSPDRSWVCRWPSSAYDPAGIDLGALPSIAGQLGEPARASRRPECPSPFLDIDAIIADQTTKIVICCGSGGVGKTTTSAALAVRAAEAGRKVVVLTIDPAKRLAQSLGTRRAGQHPAPGQRLRRVSRGGSLDAMMLDMKRTFDEVVLAHSTPDKAQAILREPVLRRAVLLLRRHPGVHGDGAARPAARRGRGRPAAGT